MHQGIMCGNFFHVFDVILLCVCVCVCASVEVCVCMCVCVCVCSGMSKPSLHTSVWTDLYLVRNSIDFLSAAPKA